MADFPTNVLDARLREETTGLGHQTDEEFYAAAERVIRDGQDLVRRAANYREDEISETPFTKLPGATSLPTVGTGRRFYLSWSHYIMLMRIDDVDERHFYVELVCYNRILRCYVLFDLKIGEFTHQDLGQMQMYANYYDRRIKLDPELMGLLARLRDAEAAISVLRVRYSDREASIAQASRLRMELRKTERECDAVAKEIKELCHV